MTATTRAGNTAMTTTSTESVPSSTAAAAVPEHVLQAVQQWEEMITQWYPRLEERAYFVPPVYFNQLRYSTQHVGGRQVPDTDHVEVLVPQPPVAVKKKQEKSVLESDVRNDRTTQRLLACLRALAERQKEVMFVLSQLDFGDYLGEPSYSAAASYFPLPSDLKPAKNGQEPLHRGDFDVLIFHREYGVLVGEVKTAGDIFPSLQLTQQQEDAIVAKKVEQAVKQLDKAETVLRHVLSDLQPPPSVRKTVMLPFIARAQLRRVLDNNSTLQQALRQCLGVQPDISPVNMCLCADNLPDTAMATCDVTDDVMAEWWRNVMAEDADFKTHYRSVVARFAGPATTVRVFSVSKPRLHVHTEGEAVSATGHCFTQVVLHPDQLQVLHQDLPLVHLFGAPGTGKTVVLVLRAVKWLQEGHQVNIVSPQGERSLAASHMIHHQVQQMAGPLAQHRLHLHATDVKQEDRVRATVQALVSKVDSQGRLFVIADESYVVRVYVRVDPQHYFKQFCDQLQSSVAKLHLWSASSSNDVPGYLSQVTFTEPLRSPLSC